MAHAALWLAAAFWGFGNIAQKLVLDHIGPLSAVCLRCAIATIAIMPLAIFERRQARQPGFWPSIVLVSASFTTALCLQQAAYLDATVTNASFLVNTCTILTPLVAWIWLRELPPSSVLYAGTLTLVGIFLMSSGILLPFKMAIGDAACLASAVFYAIWIVALGRHAQTYGLPFITALTQFSIAALAAAPFLALERTNISQIASAGPSVVVLGLFTTAAAFGLQTVAQRYTTASKAAIIVSAESIFGAIGAMAALRERPGVLTFVGAALIFSAILIVSAPRSVFARRPTR
jgi:drug/metabolite transporter (DMT)-like permease